LLLTTDRPPPGDVLGYLGDEPRPSQARPALGSKIDPKGAAEAYKARILDDARRARRRRRRSRRWPKNG